MAAGDPSPARAHVGLGEVLLQWGRIGLIRYWWVLFLFALGFFVKGRFMKARTQTNG